MKLLALAAALAMTGTAAIAQDAPTAAPPAQDTTTAPAPTAPTPAAAPAGEDPAGGYQPATPALSGQPQAGQQVIFQANPQTPSQAFPPPAPLDKYPVCKKGQTDNCRQRGG